MLFFCLFLQTGTSLILESWSPNSTVSHSLFVVPNQSPNVISPCPPQIQNSSIIYHHVKFSLLRVPSINLTVISFKLVNEDREHDLTSSVQQIQVHGLFMCSLWITVLHSTDTTDRSTNRPAYFHMLISRHAHTNMDTSENTQRRFSIHTNVTDCFLQTNIKRLPPWRVKVHHVHTHSWWTLNIILLKGKYSEFKPAVTEHRGFCGCHINTVSGNGELKKSITSSV